MYPALATLAFALLVAGWLARRRRRVHVPLVLAAIGLDLALVLILETQRGVIDQSMHQPLGWMEVTHILASIVAVVLYLPTIGLGVRMLRGAPSARVRSAHRLVASGALLARAVGFAFMWSVG